MNEVPLSQCDKCGSEVPPEDIDWDMLYTAGDCFRVFLLGLALGGVFSAVVLWFRL